MTTTWGATTAWWQKRQRFLQVATDRGLTHNPIVRGLPPHEALELVALSLCQAIYHDLEKSTGVNVWTFAQNLAAGWFEQRRGAALGVEIPVRRAAVKDLITHLAIGHAGGVRIGTFGAIHPVYPGSKGSK